MITTAVFTKIQSRLDEIAEDLAKELDPVVEQAAQQLADRAKDTTPPANDSGELKSSIKVVKYDTNQYNVVADAKAPRKPNLPYGIFLEYGTEAGGRGGGGIVATHFMGRAAEETLAEFEQMVNDKLRDL